MFKQEGEWMKHQCRRPDPEKAVAAGEQWQCFTCGRIWRTRRAIASDKEYLINFGHKYSYLYWEEVKESV